MNLDEVKEFIDAIDDPQTKIYLGSDSERHLVNGVWYADYTVVVVIHKSGRHGCKVFGSTSRELDFSQKKDRPALRLMTEVTKVADLFLSLQDVLKDRLVEVHLDLNPDKKFGSSCVVEQAIGFVKGTCNITPMVKPNALAATYCADRFKTLNQTHLALGGTGVMP